MIANYKEIRRLYDDDLRNLCINKNWYTRGNTEEYTNLLNMCNKNNITTNDIVEIATNIMNHSNDVERELSSYCFEIARIAYTFFEEIQKTESTMVSNSIIQDIDL